MKDNPRLFNNPPRSSKEWKLEHNARTSAERSNKREKLATTSSTQHHKLKEKMERNLFAGSFHCVKI